MLTRRELLASLSALLAGTACSRRESPALPVVAPATVTAGATAAGSGSALAPNPSVDAPLPPPPPRGETQLLSWTLPERGANGEAAILVPVTPSADPSAEAGATKRWPLVIALHGRGEALKGPHDGALGWVNDYGLAHAIARVSNPPLGEDDVQGFVDQDRIDGYNRQLAERPFGGLVVVCPYLPDINLRNHADLTDYAR